MKNIMPWIKFFVGLLDIRAQYEEIKKNEEARKVSTLLGWKAIKYCVLLITFAAAAIGLTMWGMSYLNNIAFFFGVILIILAIAFALYIPAFLAFALSCSVKQVKLNRKFIGIFSLILTLLLIAATGAAVVIAFNKATK